MKAKLIANILLVLGIALAAFALLPSGGLQADGAMTSFRFGWPTPWLSVTGGNAGGAATFNWRSSAAALAFGAIGCFAGAALLRRSVG